MAAADEVRAFLRLETHDEDALIEALVAAAIVTGEAFLGQVIVQRTVTEMVPAGDAWRRLATGPVVAISAVEGVAADGSAVALPVDGYAIDIDAGGDGWVRLAGGRTMRLRVTMIAGIAENWEAVPAAVAHGIVRLAAHLFMHRDDGLAPPAAIAALWRPWRRMRLGGSHAA